MAETNTGVLHPFTGALYKQEDGNIRITSGDKSGLFRTDGSWIEGELRECDPQMCNWIGGPVRISHRMTAKHD